MSDLIIQAASGPHEALLKLSERWHRAYALRHGFEYRAVYGPQQYKWPAVWDKVSLLRDAAFNCEDGTVIIWLDADVLIEEPSTDLRTARPAGADVGMVRSQVGELNAGVIWLKSSGRVVAWLNRVEQLGPVDGGYLQEQTRMNRLFPESGLIVAEVEARFNAYRWAAGQIIEPAVIRAWHAHSMPFRFHMMRRALDLLTQYHPI